jgi:hypothetical protein
MKLPVRTVLAQLSTGRVLISPGSKLSGDQLRALGRVDDLVANNCFHSGGMAQARAVFPTANCWGVAGQNYPHTLDPNRWPHQKELPMIQLHGMPKINETVFIHRQSKTLICADMVFNLDDAKGFGSWLILTMFGTYRRFGVSKFFLMQLKDKAAFQRSLTELFEHDFDNILMAHGSPIISNAKTLLLKAFAERDLKPA